MSSRGAFDLVSGESQCFQSIADIGLHVIFESDSVNRNVFPLPVSLLCLKFLKKFPSSVLILHSFSWVLQHNFKEAIWNQRFC